MRTLSHTRVGFKTFPAEAVAYCCLNLVTCRKWLPPRTRGWLLSGTKRAWKNVKVWIITVNNSLSKQGAGMHPIVPQMSQSEYTAQLLCQPFGPDSPRADAHCFKPSAWRSLSCHFAPVHGIFAGLAARPAGLPCAVNAFNGDSYFLIYGNTCKALCNNKSFHYLWHFHHLLSQRDNILLK